jgi:hypothetical protein
MFWWARKSAYSGAGMDAAKRASGLLPRISVVAVFWAAICGCSSQHESAPSLPARPVVLVVAPVLNFSGAQDFDPLKVTDLLASEFVAAGDVAVIPVNRVLAELGRRGKATAETPADAAELARTFGADATVVMAVTEYNPYDPPVIGLILQWYDALPEHSGSGGLSADSAPTPRWQVQRVFNAADEEVVKQLKEFARHRDGGRSPYGWQRWMKSQELYVRFCSAMLIRTIKQLNAKARDTAEPHEASS